MVPKIEQEHILLLGILFRIRDIVLLRGSAENTHAAQVRFTYGLGALWGQLCKACGA